MKKLVAALLFGVVTLFFFSSLIFAAAPPKLPKSLADQIQRLVELKRDSYASEYPEARMVQTLQQNLGSNDTFKITLVVFTIEGFGGGNNHTQFLAAFSPEKTEEGKIYFTLLDVIPIAGKGSRAIEKLNAKMIYDQKSGDTNFSIDALENTDGDGANFPSKKTSINLLLRDDRLLEVKK